LKLKRPVTIRIGEDVIECFKKISEVAGVPYLSLINLYLRDCVINKRILEMSWG